MMTAMKSTDATGKPVRCPKPGIHHGVPIETYLSWPAVSPGLWPASNLSMKHVKYQIDNDREPTDAMTLGSAIHCSVFEPQDFWARYALYDGERRAGPDWRKCVDENPGKEILREKDWKRCLAARDSIRSHPAARELVRPGSPVEASLVWRDKVTALDCKSRPDLIADRIVDVKSVVRIDEWTVRRTAAQFGHHVGLAAKHDGIYRLMGKRLDCVLIYVESSPPFDCVVRRLLDDVLQSGLSEWRRLLARIAACKADGVWPGISDEELVLTLPPFQPGAGLVEDITIEGEAICR